MVLTETIQVKIGSLVFYVRYSNRTFLAYTKLLKPDTDGYDALIHLFYDLAKSGAKFEGKEFNYTFEQFDDAIDPYPEAVPNFNKAVSAFLDAGGGGKKPKGK